MATISEERVLVFEKDEIVIRQLSSGAQYARKGAGFGKKRQRNLVKEAEDRRRKRLENAVDARSGRLSTTHAIYCQVMPDGGVTLSGNEKMLSCPKFCQSLQELCSKRSLDCKLIDREAAGVQLDHNTEKYPEPAWELLGSTNLVRMTTNDRKKLLSSLVVPAGTKKPRSIWGVESHRPVWWPKTQPFHTPWKTKDGRCLFNGADVLSILLSARRWHKSTHQLGKPSEPN